MKKQSLYFALFNILLLTLFACGGAPQQEYDKLKAENELLKIKLEEIKIELEEVKYGPDRLLSDAKIYLENNNFSKAKSSISLLKEKHPSSPQAIESKELSIQIEKAIKDQQEAKKKAQEAREKAEKEKLANATKKLRTSYDEMRDITWYYDKNTPQYTNYNSFYLYMGKNKTEKPWLRFRIQYAADDWLFIESFIIKTDKQSYTINTSYDEMERDNGYSGIWEWYDVTITERLYSIIKEVISSNNVKIRHNGKQYYKDRTITVKEKQGLQNILDAYEALGGTFDF